MSSVEFSQIPRPERWDVPYSPDMTDDDVDRILAAPPFNGLDPNKFRGPISLRGIIKNDSRLVRCREGDIIVRRGDWGNSAFFILSGSCRVELKPENPEDEKPLPVAMLGRLESKRKSLFESIAQLWRNRRQPEVRDLSKYTLDSRIAASGEGKDARVYLQDVPMVLANYKTDRMTAGDCFGELAALGRIPRSATVFADGEAELVEIRWQGLRDIMRRDDGIREEIDARFHERGLKEFLRKAELFQHLKNDDEMQKLADATVLESYGKFDSVGTFKQLAAEGAESGLQREPLIAREGDYPNGVILIRSGLARLSREYHNGHRTVGYLTPGQMYGFKEVLAGWRDGKPKPLASSLRAIGFVTLVVVPTALVEELVFKKLFDKKPPAEETTDSVAGMTPVDAGLPIDTELVEFLVERRFINGTATMLIDLDRCTRCDDCVRACAGTHDGNPRFLRSGPIHGQYMVANACMHCSDPVCMIECPTGAIHRDLLEGRVVINDATCTGCQACFKNCPYDAIRMVDVRGEDGSFIRDVNTALPIQKATKCDLCLDQLGGPACQRACPHDALVRVDMRDVETLGDWFGK